MINEVDYKVGDKVRVTHLEELDVINGIEVGDTGEVTRTNEDGDVVIRIEGTDRFMFKDQIELVREEGIVNMSVLIERIRQWFIDRNLHTANPQAQIAKLLEEAGELSKGVTRNDEDLIKDGIGDVVVVLIGLCTQLDLSFEECVALAYNEIKDRKGKLIDGVFVKEEDL